MDTSDVKPFLKLYLKSKHFFFQILSPNTSQGTAVGLGDAKVQQFYFLEPV